MPSRTQLGTSRQARACWSCRSPEIDGCQWTPSIESMCPIRKKEKNQDFLIIENPDCLRPWARVRIQQSIARLVMDAFFCVVETCVNTVDEVVRSGCAENGRWRRVADTSTESCNWQETRRPRTMKRRQKRWIPPNATKYHQPGKKYSTVPSHLPRTKVASTGTAMQTGERSQRTTGSRKSSFPTVESNPAKSPKSPPCRPRHQMPLLPFPPPLLLHVAQNLQSRALY